MAKYYVRSGRIKKVVDRQTRERAAFDVVGAEARSGDGEFYPLIGLQHLGLVTAVSETGFEDRRAIHFPTHCILSGSGPFQRFRQSDGSDDEG